MMFELVTGCAALLDGLRHGLLNYDGSSQGQFFCLRSDEAKAVCHDRAFWIEFVLPQMYATRWPCST